MYCDFTKSNPKCSTYGEALTLYELIVPRHGLSIKKNIHSALGRRMRVREAELEPILSLCYETAHARS